MSDTSLIDKLRERLDAAGEERLGKVLSEVLESPLLTGAIGRAFDAREKAAQAQEVAMSALNIPSAADIERLTRRLRALSHRLADIEDGVDRLDRALSGSALQERLQAIEQQLAALAGGFAESPAAGARQAAKRPDAPNASGPTASKRIAARKRVRAAPSKAAAATKRAAATKGAPAPKGTAASKGAPASKGASETKRAAATKRTVASKGATASRRASASKGKRASRPRGG